MKAKTLNLIDLVQHQKEFEWGKYYYGLFDRNDLHSYISFCNYCGSKEVLEIHESNNNQIELLQNFIQDYSQKNAKYFIRELNELSEADEISLMHKEGFKRLTRNYYYDYTSKSESTIKNASNMEIICREAYDSDIDEIYGIEVGSQILEYRDGLHRSKKYLEQNIDHIFSFADSVNTKKVYAFAIRKYPDQEIFEIVIHESLSGMLESCIECFAELYLNLYKQESFQFIINEHHKSVLKDLDNKYKHYQTNQVLVAESYPKKKVFSLNKLLFPARAGTEPGTINKVKKRHYEEHVV